jgi:hypothetical protein
MPPSIENLCPDFLAFWEQARGKLPAEQERLWHELYESPHRELLDIYFTFFGSRANLVPAFQRYDAMIPTIRRMSSAVEELIHTVEPRCGELFEVLEMDAPYVLMVGVFDSDSWSTRWRGRPTSFLAMESESNSRLRDLELTIAHESAHAYHKACRPDYHTGMIVGGEVFAEGLAVLVSTLLFPDAPEAAYLWPGGELTRHGQSCADWVAECDQRLDLLRQSMLQHLEQSDPALQSLYFHMHDQPQHPVPARAGYVVGYRVLQRLAQTYTVAEMARWPLDRVCQELRTVLALEPFA